MSGSPLGRAALLRPLVPRFDTNTKHSSSMEWIDPNPEVPARSVSTPTINMGGSENNSTDMMDISSSSSSSLISSPSSSSSAPSLNEQKAKRRSGQVLGFSESSEASHTPPPNKKVSMPNINVPLPWWFKFHLAAQIGDFELLKTEIEEIHRRTHENEDEAQTQETSRQLINVVDFEGRSALQKAVFAGTLPCVKLLISSGADPLQKDPGGCNALHFAVAGRHIACLRELLSGKDLAYRERVLYPSSSSSTSLSFSSGSEAPSYPPPLPSLILDEVIEVRTTREYVRVVLSSTSPSHPGAALSNSGSSSSSPLTTSSSSTPLDPSIFSGDKLSVYSETADMISVMSNSGVKRGKWYFEVTLLSDCSSLRIGWLMKAHSALSDSMGIGLGHDEYSFSYEGGSQHKRNKGVQKTYGSLFHRPWKKGDVVGCLADLETKSGILQFTLNGHPLGIAFKKVYKSSNAAGLLKEEREFLYPAVTLHARAWCRFNFGDSPFKYGHTIPLGSQGVTNFNYSPYCESVKVSHPSVRFDPSIQHFLPLPFYGQDNLVSWCSSCGSTDSLKELLEGISPSVAFRTTLGYHSTPLHYACQFGQYSVVKFLIEKGIPLHQSSDTATSLHTAIFGGHFECFELLMTAGADPRVSDSNGLTPLYIILGELRHNYPPFFAWVPKLLNNYGVEMTMREWSAVLPIHVLKREECLSRIFQWKIESMLEKEKARIRKSRLVAPLDMDEEDEVSTWQYLKDKGELISKQLLSRINFKVPTLKVLNANTDLLVQALLVGDESDEIVKSFKRGKWTPKLTAVVRLADCQLLQENNVGRGCLVSSEERRNKSRIFVHKFFRHLVFVFKALGVQIVLRHIDLSHTESSLRSVISLPFVKQIDTLDLSFTLISWRSLSYLNFLPNLTKLFLNHCPKLSRGVRDEEVFLQLKSKPHPNLEVISLIETSTTFSVAWLKSLEAGCPKLSVIYYTCKRGDKVVGLEDSIMMQTMMDPHLLPCGHIADKPTLDQLVRKECFLDRVPFRRADLIHFMPHITKLEKISKKAFLSSTSPSTSSGSSSSSLDPPSPGTSSATSSPSIQGARKHSLKPADIPGAVMISHDHFWRVAIVDAWPSCRPLESKVLLHVGGGCGEFFNLSTFQKYYLNSVEGSLSQSDLYHGTSGMVGSGGSGGSGSAGGPTGGYAGGGGGCYGVAGGVGVGSGGGSTPRLGTGSGRFLMVPPPRMIDPEEMIQRAAAEEWLCTGCMKPLTELRICYPNAGADTTQEFLDLNFVATYLVGDS